MRFSLAQPRPWLCMTVAIPYLVVVCGMGYIRQGIAISFPGNLLSNRMIELKIARLSEDDRRLLVAASVQGHEFEAATVARAHGRWDLVAEINALESDELSCVVVRSGQEPVVVNLDLDDVEADPEPVRWVDDLHS